MGRKLALGLGEIEGLCCHERGRGNTFTSSITVIAVYLDYYLAGELLIRTYRRSDPSMHFWRHLVMIP
jgi:hypothetical protein